MNWRTLMKGGETHKNLPKIPNITPKRPLEGGFEDIGDVLEVKTPTPGQPLTQKSGGDTLLKKIPDRIRVIPDTPPTEPSPEALAFNFNANLLPNENASTPQEFVPAGTRVAYQSPLFGELEAEVLDDRGACLWVWHPLRQCEACIPRGWVIGPVVHCHKGSGR